MPWSRTKLQVDGAKASHGHEHIAWKLTIADMLNPTDSLYWIVADPVADPKVLRGLQETGLNTLLF